MKNEMKRHYLVQSHSTHKRHKKTNPTKPKHGSKGGTRVARDYVDQGTAKADESST